jgi:hypothetical protein
LFKEAAVAQSPEPAIEVLPTSAGDATGLYVSLRYSDSQSGQASPVSFSIGKAMQ